MAILKNNELGYLGNPNVKRDGIEAQFTLDEIGSGVAYETLKRQNEDTIL